MGKIKNLLNRKKIDIRHLTTGYIILLVMVVLVWNMMAAMAVDRFGWKADLTAGRLYKLTDATNEIISSLDQEVKVIYLNDKERADTNVRELLQRMERLSGNFRVEYINLTLNPGLAAAYEQKGQPVSPDGLVISSAGRERFVSWIDLYQVDPGASTVTAFRAEQQIISAIRYTTSGELPIIGFVDGHNEDTKGSFVQLARMGNYQVDTINLMMDDPKEEIAALVIGAPSRDFTPQEIQKLDRYMQQGGGIILFRNPQIVSLPNLDLFLEEWGLVIENNMIYEPSQQVDDPSNLVPYYYPHLITTAFSENHLYMLMPQSRGITLYERAGKTITPVLISTQQAYSAQLMEGQQEKEQDGQAPFVLAATSEASVQINGQTKMARLFLAGSREMYQEELLKVESFANADFLMQVLGWCVQTEEMVNIPARSIMPPSLNITWTEAVVLSTIFLFVVPAGILAIGIATIVRRRHL